LSFLNLIDGSYSSSILIPYGGPNDGAKLSGLTLVINNNQMFIFIAQISTNERIFVMNLTTGALTFYLKNSQITNPTSAFTIFNETFFAVDTNPLN